MTNLKLNKITEGLLDAFLNAGEVAKKICAILDKLIPEKLNGISSYSELITYVEDRPGHDVRYAIDSNKIKNN